MDARPTIAAPALAVLAWLAGAVWTLALVPVQGSAASTVVTLGVLLLIPGLLVALALRLHVAWRSPWSGVAVSAGVGAGVVLPVAWATRALGVPLEHAATILVALELIPLTTIGWRARTGRLGRFEGLRDRGRADRIADASVLLGAAALLVPFVGWIEPAMPGGDLWYYLSYIDWMIEQPGAEYVPHSIDPEEWSPRLQGSGFLALEAMVSRLTRVDANGLQTFWSWLPLALIPLALIAGFALATALGAGPVTRTLFVAAQVGLVFATLPYVFDRTTSGARWPATVWLLRTSQDKVFLATVLAPTAAALGAEWLARGERRWLAALFAVALACAVTHPLGLPFFAMGTLPFALLCVVLGPADRAGPSRQTTAARVAVLLVLMLPLLAWPLAQRGEEGAPTTLADEAGFARREHLTRDSLRIQSRSENQFTAHPSLIAHPLMIAAIGCGLGVALLARRRTAARYAFATTAAPLLMLYTPGIAPLAGQVVTPYLLWRFTWLLPLALALAVATSAVGRLAARRIPGKRWAGPTAATAFALATALATGLPTDLARVPASLALLTPTAIPAEAAERWIASLRTHVDDETLLLGPTTQPLVLSLGAGIRTGWWRSGSDPERYVRIVDFFGSRLFAPRHAALLDELDVGFVGVLHDEPIAAELALRTERFTPVARLGELELHRVIDHSPAPDPIDYWRARSRAAADRPERTLARSRLSLALLEADRLDEARSELESALASGDADAATHEQRGTLALLDGDPRRARDELQRSLALDPDRAVARNNLVWLLATSPVEAIRDPDEAVRHAEILLSGRTQDAGSLDTAAAAWAADGDFDRAEQLARRSLLLYESAGVGADALLPIRERLDAYRARRPWIDVAD